MKSCLLIDTFSLYLYLLCFVNQNREIKFGVLMLVFCRRDFEGKMKIIRNLNYIIVRLILLRMDLTIAIPSYSFHFAVLVFFLLLQAILLKSWYEFFLQFYSLITKSTNYTDYMQIPKLTLSSILI